MAGPGAPKAPEEREGAAAAVAARSVSAPPTAANSNVGLFTSPRPPRLKETQPLRFLPVDPKESCSAGPTVSASSATWPGNLRTAPPNASVHRHTFPLRN